MTLISFIFPVYNEQENINKLMSEMLILKERMNESLEIIFVDDGSTDKSRILLNSLAQRYPFVKAVSFSRNFGHQVAITAGLDFATGKAAVIMDSDLQDPPLVALELIAKWREGFEVVYAKRRTRKDPAFKKIAIHASYRIIRALSRVDIPEDSGDFRLVSRKVIDELKKCHEQNRYIRGLTSFIGFKQISVLYDRQERYKGHTHYPLRKLIQLAINGIMGFSVVPLRIISYIGLIATIISFFGILYFAGLKLFSPETVIPGLTFVIIAVFFIGSVQMIMLGIIGEYIGRIYTETQNRPLYIIKDSANIDS